MGRLLGIDYGKKRVGLAITDEIQMLSSPFAVYMNDDSLFDKLFKLQSEYCFEKAVVGYPYSETYQEASEAVKRFAEKLHEKLKIGVVFQNEEFSSVYADSFLKSTGANRKKIKESIDKYAAQKILEDYLKSIQNQK